MATAKEYVVAEGMALTSKKGIRGPGEEITADMLHGGKTTFDKWVDDGGIVEKPKPKVKKK